MRKRVVIPVVVVLVLIGAIAVLLLNLEGLVNRNKDFLLSQAESTLGREVSVGEIGVTLLGGIGVRLQDFSLADDPSFSSEPFIEAKDLQVNLKLLPLLKKEFEVKRIILHDPVIRVIRNQSGILNTNTLGGGKNGSTGNGSETEPSVGAAAPLVVSLINIDGGELHYLDKAADLDLRATQIESHVEDLDFDKPVSIEMRAAVLAEERNFELRGTFGPVPGDRDFSKVPVDAKASLDAIGVETLVSLMPKMKDSLPPGLQVSGPVSLSVKATGTLPNIPMSVEIDATSLALDMPGRLRKPAEMPLRLTSDARFEPERILFDGATLAFHTLEAAIKGSYGLGNNPAFDMEVETKQTNLTGWDAILPVLEPYGLSGQIEFAGRIRGAVSELKPGRLPAIDGKARISDGAATLPQLPKPLSDIAMDIALAGEQMKITGATLRIGDSQVQGEANVETLTPLTVQYQIISPALALIDVRPPNPNTKKPEVLNNAVAKGRLVAERKTNRGELTSTSGSLANYDYRDLKAKYFLTDKDAKLEDIELQALGGSLTGSGVVTFDEESPGFDFDTQSRDLNLVETFDALPMFASRHISGRANLDLKIAGKGKDWATTQKTIVGDGFAEMFEGELVDVNVFNSIITALTDATGVSDFISQGVKNKYPKVFQSKNTEFNDLKSTFVVENGKLLARNLRLNADDYVMVGKGAIDFNRGLDLQVTLLVSERLTADVVNDVKEAQYLKNDKGQIEIPFVLNGTLPRVSAKPDPDYINTVVQRALVKKGFNLFNNKGVKDLLDFGGKKNDTAPPDTTSGP